MSESLKTRLTRWKFNFFPAYRGTGARVTYLAADWREARIKVPLNRSTRNVVGTIFGGSLYGGVDPFYMLMLIQLLGSDYVVWDEAAKIEFKKAARSTMFAKFAIDDQEIAAIKSELEHEPVLHRVYHVDLADQQGVVHASVEKTLYIRKRKRAQSTPAAAAKA